MQQKITRPKMILFDYGQTLGNEKFDGIKGTEAVMKYAVQNKYGVTARQVQDEAEAINGELGRFDPAKRHLNQVEIPNYMFTSYLYESMGVKLSLTSDEIDQIFWDNAAPAVPTEGIEDFLEFLHEQGIRTGVISNITYAANIVKKRINTLLPNNHFEFIIATSDYLFRKPNKRIFQFALEKADLKPEDVWYIGDQYEADIVGASGAGLFPVWYQGAIDLPFMPKEGVVTVQSWAQLQKMMEEL